jgi:phospholipid transport system substrate-binding protein
VAAGAPEGGRANVTTAVARTEGGDVPLEYLLQERDGRWKIINVVADGVSDLALKRAEYQRILAAGTLDTLIAELEAQTQRLRTR